MATKRTSTGAVKKKKTNADLLLNRERYMVTKNMESQKYSMPLFQSLQYKIVSKRRSLRPVAKSKAMKAYPWSRFRNHLIKPYILKFIGCS